MNVVSGDNRISGDITFIPVLLDKIKKYPNSNRIIFGVNSNKKPAPVLVKKMIVVLVSANILRHTGTVGTKENIVRHLYLYQSKLFLLIHCQVKLVD